MNQKLVKKKKNTLQKQTITKVGNVSSSVRCALTGSRSQSGCLTNQGKIYKQITFAILQLKNSIDSIVPKQQKKTLIYAPVSTYVYDKLVLSKALS